MGLRESLGLFVGQAEADDIRDIGKDFFTVFFRGMDVGQIDNRFVPAAGFKNQSPAGFDDAHAKAHFFFRKRAGFDEIFLFLHDLRQSLIQQIRRHGVDP